MTGQSEQQFNPNKEFTVYNMGNSLARSLRF